MRKLTISSLWRQTPRAGGAVPHLRLSGRWLEAAGFRQGARVVVRVEAGQLVITSEDRAQ